MIQPVIGIMGSGKESWSELSKPLAEWIARQGYHLLTGGGGGVMASAAEAFCAITPRRGLSIGVVPTTGDNHNGFVMKDGYPNQWVELPILSPLSVFDGSDQNALTRNHINILTSHVIVALPGTKGTINEVDLALRFAKPIIVYGAPKDLTSFPYQAPQTRDLQIVQRFIVESLQYPTKTQIGMASVA